MKCRLLISGVIFFCLSLSSSYSQKINADYMLSNSSQGRDFFIAIPPNECDGGCPVPTYTYEIALEFYVTSTSNCTVSLEMPSIGFKVTKPVKAMEITTFSSIWNEIKWDWEVRESEKVLDKGIWIHADQPISVYFLNHRVVTADGFLAIPVTSCGTDYIHLAYYDFSEVEIPNCPRGGGFIITAGEDNTKINIQLKGYNIAGARGKTLGGHHIGDTWTVTLNKSQIYCVMGDGLTREEFDISGSRVTSNKPIGFISFHMRTLIPLYDLWNGRNCMNEMMPPVTAWGKKYCTVEYKRNGYGDFFRIIAKDDNTKFTVKWYDLASSQLLGQRSGTMKRSGDWFEFEEAYVPRFTTNTIKGIRGTSVWEADKPVLVMQYSYSQDWDNDTRFDPFMILVVPTEQFIPSTVFQTPAVQAQFLDNYFNIVAIGDTNDVGQAKLQTIMLDGKRVTTIEPSFSFNRIPTTSLYWAKLRVGPGSHKITSDTKFGGYIYGFSSADGYGWPAATAFNKIDETDTLPPILNHTDSIGDFFYTATEFRNGGINDNPRQVDQGIQSVETIESNNYDLILLDTIRSYPPLYIVIFNLIVRNKSKPGKAVFVVTDMAGNFTIDSVTYLATSIIEFKIIRGEPFILPNPVGSEASLIFSLSEGSFVSIKIIDIYGRKVSGFEPVYYPQGFNRIELNTDRISSGLYFIELSAGKEVQRVKLVVNH